MDRISTLYAKWLNDDLLPEELEELKASGAMEEFEDMLRVVDTLKTPAFDVDAAYQQSLERRNQKGKTRIFQIKRYMAVAAVLIFLVAASLWFFTPISSQYHAANEYARDITLNEGSSIQLNDGSSLTLRRQAM